MNIYNSFKLILVLSFVFFSNLAVAQFGVSVMYNLHQSAEDWDEYSEITDENILTNSLSFSVDYWFRLKDYRIEFLPEIGYSAKTVSDAMVQNRLNEEIDFSKAHLLLNTNIYLLDIEGDCNCPTFGKEGGLFKKGFYVQVSPGISYYSNNIGEESSSSLSFYAAIGAGLDVGITKLLTLTPFVRFTRSFGSNWTKMAQEISPGPLTSKDISSDVSEIQTGLRLGYRLDYKGR